MSATSIYPASLEAPPAPDERRALRRARAWCARYARARRENFTVLSRLAPRDVRADMAIVYAFCRAADDLADETGADASARARSLELLAEFRHKLRVSVSSRSPSQDPLFIALGDLLRRRRIPLAHFEDLLDAFELDQRVSRHQRWQDLLGYSARSANPVGRIVLALHGLGLPGDESRDAAILAKADALCTALQLTNFWQDVKRDLLERDRVYLPFAETGLAGEELRAWIHRPNDRFIRRRYADEVKVLCERTRELFDQSRDLPALLPRRLAWMIWLFQQGGEHVLAQIEHAEFTTLWERPTLSARTRLRLLSRAILGNTLRTRP
jgi:squalene synthase HpnC